MGAEETVFRFKQFSVRNCRSAMKVNTDGVLLGAAVTVDGTEKEVLDIGTGTGTVALMMAQRIPGAYITGIDIDVPSAEEAAQNFASSPWADRLKAIPSSLQSYVAGEGQISGVSLILSNPPYYDDSLLNPDGREAVARHSVTLSYREVLSYAEGHLLPEGRVAMVLPEDLEKAVVREARSRDLFPSRILRIRTVPRKAPSRMIVECSRTRREAVEEELTIRNADGNYSEEYLCLTDGFYL